MQLYKMNWKFKNKNEKLFNSSIEPRIKLFQTEQVQFVFR